MSAHREVTSAVAVGPLRSLVADLFHPRPGIYWADFLVFLTIGYGAATVYLSAPLFSFQQIFAWLFAVLALYRVGIFMHEIVHFRHREMTAFKIGWNILAGIPMLTPSFLYDVHIEHHNTKSYGTKQDAEYLPLAHGPWRRVLAFLAQPLILPLYFALRFALVVPISFLHPKIRIWLLERMSSNAINFHHRRELSVDDPRKMWAVMDIACCLRIWLMFTVSWIGPVMALQSPEIQRRFPALTLDLAWRPLQLYLIAVGILFLNHIRTLVAHRYQSMGSAVSHTEQLLDSVDIIGDPIFTELICPLGLRFHALHHLFPALPYHNMGKAHRRIMAALPVDSPYRKIVFSSLPQALLAFVGSMRELSSRHPNGADLWYGSSASATAHPATDGSSRSRNLASQDSDARPQRPAA